MTVAEVHLVATTFMAGVIVFVQIVHYPLMSSVGIEGFVTYERGHTVRTGWVVGPPMVLEAATSLLLVLSPEHAGARPLAGIGIALLAVIWLGTALVQAPAHARLTKGFDPTVHRRLVKTNWVRTTAWLARVPVAVMLV